MDRGIHHHALVRTSNGLRVATVPTPSLSERDILVGLSFVGVCGTDLQILSGARPDSAEILGHEAAGVVVAAGPAAPLMEGRRVVFNPSAQLTKGRILGHNVPGLFQQYFLVDPQAVEDGLVQGVEDGFPEIHGALVEPVAGVIYAYELISHVVSEVKLAVVFGAGPIGLIAAEHLRERGARVLLVHSNQKRLDTVRDLGLLDSGSMMVIDDTLTERVLSWSGGDHLDAALICTSMAGASAALSHAVRVLRTGGCIEMVTNFPLSSPTPDGISAAALRAIRAANICGVPGEGAYVETQIAGRRLFFTSHRGTSRDHLTCAMRMLSFPEQRYSRLITHVLSLQDAAAAIQTLAHTRKASIADRDCIKAVVDLSRSI